MPESSRLDRETLERLGVQTRRRTEADELMAKLVRSKDSWTKADTNRLTDAIRDEAQQMVQAQLEILRRRQAESGQ